MFGTLIGIFITSTAIVIGADRAVSLNGVMREQTQKICATGPRSVVSLQGHYSFPLNPPDKPDEWFRLVNILGERCALMEKAGKDVPLEKQADMLSEELRNNLAANIKKNQPGYLAKTFSEHPRVNYLSVVGFSNGKVGVTVRELKLRRLWDGQWEPFVTPAKELSPIKCGAVFHGQNRIANWLLNGEGRKNPPFPAIKFSLPEVIAGRDANKSKTCSCYTSEQATALYKTAVHDTILYGKSLGTQEGEVGGALDIWSISSDGKVLHEEVPEGKY